jgi:hypothetical protein
MDWTTIVFGLGGQRSTNTRNLKKKKKKQREHVVVVYRTDGRSTPFPTAGQALSFHRLQVSCCRSSVQHAECSVHRGAMQRRCAGVTAGWSQPRSHLL